DAASEQQKQNVGYHLDAYVSTLTGSAMHRENTRSYLKRLVADCRWVRLADMRRSDLECWLSEQVRLNRSARSRNAYQTAMVSFCNWCVGDGRMTDNPFAKMPKANLDADPRRKRRAMTPVELAKLMDGADREISAIIDQEGRAAPHDQVRFEEIGAWIGVARHAVRSAELGRAQDVA
ncbi:MAG TPA: hypothetical protein VKF17_14455, partial [Isosphaeraceae bacterium]|nr:hypothetical protein [Isosphaeraceae bacterium]